MNISNRGTSGPGPLLSFEDIGRSIGLLVTTKNKVYGDSFSQSHRIMEVLYPNGISVEQYKDALTVIRVIDKLFRIATDKDALGETPWKDICGYSILSIWRDNNESQI